MENQLYTATARNSQYASDSGNTSSISGIATREEAIKFFQDSQFNFGTFEDSEGNILAVWGRDIGMFDAVVDTPAEPTVRLDREPKVRISRYGAAVQIVESETVQPPAYSDMTDDELKAYILGKIQTDTQWLRRAIVAIYERQTLDEKQTNTTKHHNGVGFNGLDAEFLGSIAKKIIARRFSLSERQISASRNAMVKYVGQLARITREKHPRRK